MKYLRRPHKCSRVAEDGASAPPPKRPVKPVMPQVAPVGVNAVGEDNASHARNTKMLQALYKQVRIVTCVLYQIKSMYTCCLRNTQ